MDYKTAGVDIEKGDALVDWLKEDQGTNPHEDKVLDGIGGFASIFKLDFPNMEEPCLVSATDGIGTKLKLAIEMQKYDTLGQDLVAMCANDLICTGAQPLFFLDYFATSHLDLAQVQPFLTGLRKACHRAQMALIGGETAEMPGLYKARDFDCAGFAVGVVDRKNILGPDRVKVGDRIVGVSSSGFHSNGFSLLRKLFDSEEDMKHWGEQLLTPTALYVDLVMAALKVQTVSALAHITGGGIHNITRVLPKDCAVQLKTWEFPEIVKEAHQRMGQNYQEILKTFNCGVGLVFILPENSVDSIAEIIKVHGYNPIDLGEVVAGEKDILFPQEWQ